MALTTRGMIAPLGARGCVIEDELQVLPRGLLATMP